MNTRSYYEILNDMKTNMIANQSKITDFNEGSIVMTIFGAIASIMEEAYLDTRFGYDMNLQRLAYNVFGLKQKDGTSSTTKVKFTLKKVVTTSTQIPIGTQISDGSHKFETTGNCVVEAGDLDSNEVSATSIEVGSDNNVKKNAINVIVSILEENVASVTNTQAAEGGTDSETNQELQQRFKEYINGLQGTNVYGIRAGILAVNGVRSVNVIENFNNTESAYNVNIYVDDGQGTLSNELKEKIEKLIEGDGTVNNPGLRPAGVWCKVNSASPVDVSVKLKVKTTNITESKAIDAVTEIIKNHLNGLVINKDVLLSDIIYKIKQQSYITDVQDVELKVSGGTWSDENISILYNQVARYDTATVEVIQ